MKGTSFLLLLILSILLIALTSTLVKPAAAQDPVIVGKWDRTDGVDRYTIYANQITETVIEGQTYRGTWEYDAASGYKYIFYWEHSPPGQAPFIDYVTVADDGQSYSGYNNYGDQFHCVRISSETDSVPGADSGFPIVYVAVGGGIAAIAGVGAAAYYFFVASKAAAAAGTAAAPPSGTSGNEPSDTKKAIGSDFSGSLTSDGAKEQAEIDKLKAEVDRMKAELQSKAETLEKTPKPSATDNWSGERKPDLFEKPAAGSPPVRDDLEKFFIEKNIVTPEQQKEFLDKVQQNVESDRDQMKSARGWKEAFEKTKEEFILKQKLQELKNEGLLKEEVGDRGESSGNVNA